jgi:hypothetical protein
VSTRQSGTRWIIGMSARQCRGEGSSWLTSHLAPPPPPFTAWHFDWSPVGWMQPGDIACVGLATSPAAPPPRS